MKTRFIEAENRRDGQAFNWGKFMVAQFDAEEWERRSGVPEAESARLLLARGWTPKHLLVVDLETGEGAFFLPGGYAKADLDKHQVWVCPMFEPLLNWLYEHWAGDLEQLPALVTFDYEDAPPAMQGFRRDRLERAISEAAYALDPNQGEKPNPSRAYQWLRTTFPPSHPNYVDPESLS